MEYKMLPSSTSSFWPVTVTVCGASQFATVNTSGLVDVICPSVASLEDNVIDTPAAGSESSTAVNVAVPPGSVVGPLTGDTVTPAVSSSSFVTDTSEGLITA